MMAGKGGCRKCKVVCEQERKGCMDRMLKDFFHYYQI